MREPLWYRVVWWIPPAVLLYFLIRAATGWDWEPRFVREERDRLDAIILEKYGVNK